MLDVSLFRNLRFSAASGSIMTIFFALSGFVFLITQYFQFLKGYAPFSTGLRILPVATCIAIGSVVGVRLSVTVGTRPSSPADSPWSASLSLGVHGQHRHPLPRDRRPDGPAGVGMGFTTAPATEAIMGVVPKEKAGVGSAVNDATRQLGGTLGVAIIGSVYASRYAWHPRRRGHAARTRPRHATDSIGAALTVAGQPGPAGQPLLDASQAAFFDGFQSAASSPPVSSSPAPPSPPASYPPAPPSPPHPNPECACTRPRKPQAPPSPQAYPVAAGIDRPRRSSKSARRRQTRPG